MDSKYKYCLIGYDSLKADSEKASIYRENTLISTVNVYSFSVSY